MSQNASPMRWSSHLSLTSHLLPLNSPPLSKPADHLDRLLLHYFPLWRAYFICILCRGGHFLWLAHFLSKFCWTTDAWPTFGAPPTRRGQTVFASKIILFSLCEIIVWQKIGSEAQRKCYMSGVWCEQATYSYAITIYHLQTATDTRPLEGLVWFDVK